MLKLTAIWQDESLAEREWIRELFSPHISVHIYDGCREVVLDNSILIDSYLHARNKDYYRKFHGLNAWLLHLSDETYEGGCEVYDNFRGIFRNYWSAIFNPSRVMTFPLGYIAGISRAGYGKASDRTWLWSFLGGGGKASRPEMLQSLEQVTPHFRHVTDGSAPLPPLSRHKYEEVLRDSVFAPCPMGNVNLECFRIYEALECGSIPILERRTTLDYFRGLLGDHPLPTISNWREAQQIIATLSENRTDLDALQRTCLDWWKNHKIDISGRIGNFLDNDSSASQPFASWQHALPGWQFFELTRHHSLPAFGRRCKAQFSRLVSEGKLRKTYGR
ncbi:MAG TPA: hypothetical protein VHT24_13165 [Pseudacidobacterium sp.]|jgi:hypothetical protein|nr:hypothetical protein [Pseudacidobacterium sp.]